MIAGGSPAPGLSQNPEDCLVSLSNSFSPRLRPPP
jgi:hypothetical protein